MTPRMFTKSTKRISKDGELEHTVGDEFDVAVTTAGHNVTTRDEVFGDIRDDGPNYRDVGWLGASVLILKSQIGLGVLGLPFSLQVLGIVPGILCLVAVALITTWSGYVIGTFKLRHRGVYSVVDVGELFFGKIGREIFAAIYCTFMIFVVGSAIVGASIGLNAISLHATCTAVFIAVCAIVGFLLASVQTLGKISWLGWVGLISIVAAVLTLTVSVGVQDRPALAPQTGEWDKDFRIIGQPTFLQASSAISNLILAYAGVPTYFAIASEMRDPRLYSRSMLISQAIITAIYIALGTVVYYFCGQYIDSPALGSAGTLMKRICYGISLPGLFVTITIYLHLPAKYIFLRLLKGSEHLASNTVTHWAVWLGCTVGCTLAAYIIASAIPIFNGLVGLIGALFATFLSIMLMGAMWLFDNWERRSTDRSFGYRAMVALNVFLVVLGLYLMISGTWGAVQDIIDSYNAEGGSSPWSCRDNSNST